MKTDPSVIHCDPPPCLQPLHVSVNTTLKKNVWKLYSEWVTGGGYQLMRTGKIRRLSAEMMYDKITWAWGMVSTELIKKNFLKTEVRTILYELNDRHYMETVWKIWQQEHQKAILRTTAAKMNKYLCMASKKLVHKITVNEILWFPAHFQTLINNNLITV